MCSVSDLATEFIYREFVGFAVEFIARVYKNLSQLHGLAFHHKANISLEAS